MPVGGPNTVSLYHFNAKKTAVGCYGSHYPYTHDSAGGKDLYIKNGGKLSATSPFASGASFKFDGINDSLCSYGDRCPAWCGRFHSLSNLPQGTVDAYVNVTGFSGSDCGIIGVSSFFSLGVGTDRKAYVDLGGVNLKSNKILKLKKWYWLAATWDGGTLKIYINGVLDNQIATSNGIPTNSGTMHIGALGDDFSGNPTDSFCRGYIDEIRFSNAALY